MTKYSDSSDEVDTPRQDHVEKRWRQLHKLEIKRGDAVLNYLFLVSGGAAAATLTYIGNLTKDGTTVPIAAFWMLGFFSIALLVVGLLKISLIYYTVNIFKGWRSIVGDYYQDKLTWSEALSKDEANVRNREWQIPVLGWTAFGLIAAGVIIGFISLKEESARVRTEKTSSTPLETRPATSQTCPKPPCRWAI